MHSRAQDLPYDVWEYITTFLPSQEIKRLLDVNHTLFNIAMNERYRTATIGSLLQKETRRSLARLTDPDVASRVHRLIFKPGDICRAAQENARRKSIAIESKAAAKIQSIIKGSSTSSKQRMEAPAGIHSYHHVLVDEAVENILAAMTLLKGLTSLVIDINTSEHWYFQQAAIPFFDVGWSTFRTSLQSLELRVPVEDLALILPPKTLPNLDTISLWVIRSSIIAHEDIIMVDTILPFLQSHRRTLRSLTLDVAERTNLSPLLLELHLPSLIHFKLVQPYFKQGEADYTGLQRFFKMHRSHLTRLEIVVGLPSVFDLDDSGSIHYPFFAQECFSVPFPHLEHLFIDYSFSDSSDGGVVRDSVINYIHQFRSTLLSLTLGSAKNWSTGSVKILVEGFITTARLQRLDISVLFFQSELLRILAANLPNLEVLSIRMLGISPCGDVHDMDTGAGNPFIALFVKEIRALFFPQWRLRTLNLQVTGAGSSAITAVSYLETDECKAALLEALPNVQTFCGLSRDEYRKH